MKSKYVRGIAGFVIAAAIASCATNEPAPKEGMSLEAVSPRTEFKPLSADTNDHALLVPRSMLTVAYVTSAKTVAREGPGGQFPVSDIVFEHGQRLLVFDQIGVWAKVLEVASGQTGWLHKKTITKPAPNNHPIEVHSALLPVVFAIQPIGRLVAYDAVRDVPAVIPKGASFTVFSKQKGKTLIWLKESNSVAWLPLNEAQ